MDASIIVCTYNRAESLKGTLSALSQQQVKRTHEWEVIVVDNNSSDDTHQVVENARKNFFRIHYTFEEKQGLSHARNKGISIAKGKTILFTDDDVIPEKNWLEATLNGLKKYNADACGGYIAPIWETTPPAWLTERFYGFLALRTDRTDDHLIDQSMQTPFGANMAFKKNVFDKVGMFDTLRGRKGKTLASGEDGELFERIISAGLKVVFLARSRVHHKIESFRLTKNYFRRWRFQCSFNIAQSKGIRGKRRFVNIPLYIFPQLFRAIGRFLWAKIALPDDEAFHREIIVCHFLGLMYGLYNTR